MSGACACNPGNYGQSIPTLALSTKIGKFDVTPAGGFGVRLIHVVPAVTKESSGPSYSVQRLCESLCEAGHNVSLAALQWENLPPTTSILKTFPMGLGPRKLGRSPLMYRWLQEQCENQHVKVVHNHGMWQMNSVYPAWVTRKTQAKLVYSIRGAFSSWAMRHGSATKRIFWPLLQRQALNKADCLHATAEAEYLDIRRLGFRQPVAIIPNGIDVPKLRKRPRPNGRTLLFLGRVHVVKGLDILLPAWARLQSRHHDWRLVIAGDDRGYHGRSGYLEFLKKKAVELGLKRIHFSGPIYGESKIEAYQDAELYVLPSYSENFAVTVAESLSTGTPVVASKGSPWAELVDERAGWWVDIGVEPLVAVLDNALSRSEAELAAMGQRGRNWMERDFSWNGVGKRMCETYRWLCDRSLPVPDWVRLD